MKTSIIIWSQLLFTVLQYSTFCALFPVIACRPGSGPVEHDVQELSEESQLCCGRGVQLRHDCQLFIVLSSRESADAWSSTADGLLRRMLCGSQTGIYGTKWWLFCTDCRLVVVIMIYCEICYCVSYAGSGKKGHVNGRTVIWYVK